MYISLQREKITVMEIKRLIKEALERRESRISRIIEGLESMKPFTDTYCIPEPPILDRELYERYVIPNFIRCGAIPTDRLVKGKTYLGSCRNADKAVWLGDEFEYQRMKFNSTYPERIKNFDSEDGCTGNDVYVPIKEL